MAADDAHLVAALIFQFFEEARINASKISNDERLAFDNILERFPFVPSGYPFDLALNRAAMKRQR